MTVGHVGSYQEAPEFIARGIPQGELNMSVLRVAFALPLLVGLSGFPNAFASKAPCPKARESLLTCEVAVFDANAVSNYDAQARLLSAHTFDTCVDLSTQGAVFALPPLKSVRYQITAVFQEGSTALVLQTDFGSPTRTVGEAVQAARFVTLAPNRSVALMNHHSTFDADADFGYQIRCEYAAGIVPLRRQSRGATEKRTPPENTRSHAFE